MKEKEPISIANGVEGIYIDNSRFNTTLISFNFYLPLKAEDICANALLTYVLSTCSGKYGGFKEMNRRLNMLYGADVAVSAVPVGDTQLLRFVITVINDRFTPDNEAVVEKACDYIMSLIFEPRVKENSFYEDDVNREKRKMLEDIEAELNEKRTFARKRLKEEMFENDPFGIGKLGTVKEAKKITGTLLYKAWENMLSSAFVRIHVIGETLPEGLFGRVGEKFSRISRDNIFDYKKISNVKERKNVKRVTECMDVLQGKLVMGFSSKIYGNDEQSVSLMVATDIFGGGPYSKLFSVVREKLSLCYYCSASSVRNKGFVMVDSGLESENAEKAQTEILSQLEKVQNGDFSDFEFDSSIKSIVQSLNSYQDSLNALDVWYALKIHNNKLLSPGDVVKLVEKVTHEDVKNAAQGIKLNTVYLLLPEVTQSENR